MAFNLTKTSNTDEFQPVYFTFTEEVVTLLTVTILILLYLGVGILGARNAYTFLIKQDRLKQALLTSFYIFSILTCMARVSTFIVIIITYLVKQCFMLKLVIESDIICSFTMLSVGVVQALCCFHLSHAL